MSFSSPLKTKTMTSTSFLNTSGRGNASLVQQLPQLTQETEFQELLMQERIQKEQSIGNYQQLKQQHSRLQDEYMQLQNEIKTTIEESRIVQEKYKTMYEQSRKDLAEKLAELEDLKTKVMTPQRLEIIRMQVSDEIERTYKEKFLKQEQEIDEHRSESNKLKYQFNFLKSEYDFEKQEQLRMLEELKLQHQAEVSNIRKERDSTITRIQSENTQDSQRVRALQRENAQLHLKIKSLESEIEELRACKEKLGLELDSVGRTHSKQLTELNSSVNSLQVERESLKRQVDNTQRELTATSHTHDKLTTRIHELEKDNVLLKNKSEEVIHKSKVDVTNLKMDMLKQRGDLERERDKLLNQLEDLRTKLEISKHTIDQQSSHLVDKERDSVRRVQAAREEEFEKLARLENEKLELETKLQETERRKIDEETHRQAEKEKNEERVKSANSAREVAEREVLVYKTKLQHMQSLEDQIERERRENSELKSKVNQLESELNGINSNEQELTDQNLKFRNQVELLKEELKLTHGQLDRIQNNHDHIVAQQKSSNIEEKTQLELRLHEIQDKYGDSQSKLRKASAVQKKYKSKYQRLADSFRSKLELLKARNEQLELEKQTLQKAVPQDIYNKIKKQWRELHKRHTEFRSIMLSSGMNQVAIGDLSFASAGGQADFSAANLNISLTEQEKQHQEDIRLLKQRLETLDDNQRQQLEELHDIAHSTLKFEDDSSEKGDDEKYSSS